MASHIGRRKFLATLGGAAAGWPLTVRAQQSDRTRRIGILMTIAANDPESQARIVAFAQSLQALGWTDGRNARIDIRSSTSSADTAKYAAELVALPADVILANGTEAVGPLQAASRTIPVVFVLVPDPVGQGFVQSLARPGGNVTGFTLYEFGMGGKWLQLLKEIAPSVTRAAVIRDATTTGGVGQFAAIHRKSPANISWCGRKSEATGSSQPIFGTTASRSPIRNVRVCAPTRDRMRRCEFITLLGGAAVAWPLAERAAVGQDRPL